MELHIVAPDHRRRGLGRALLDNLLEQTTSPRALLTVRDTARAARALYERSGWVALARLEPDITLMGLRLAPPHPGSD